MIGPEEFNPHMVPKVKKNGSRQIYHLGIIDYLQVWDTSKKLERFVKTVSKPSIYNKLSAVPPDQYRERFKDFMREYVFVEQKELHYMKRCRGNWIKQMKNSFAEKMTD